MLSIIIGLYKSYEGAYQMEKLNDLKKNFQDQHYKDFYDQH